MSNSNKNTIVFTFLDNKNEEYISSIGDVRKVEMSTTLLRLFITHHRDGDTQIIFLDHFKDSLTSLQFSSDIELMYIK
ncbi:hypothetical protein GC005_01215 [Staphylococcus pseudintermedius]|nr:hypothetical protein [Staphylococcus pseudintermedius]